MKHIQTIETRDLCAERQERRLRRVPDLLPVCLQDQLRCCQSGLRERRTTKLSRENHGAALDRAAFLA